MTATATPIEGALAPKFLVQDGENEIEIWAPNEAAALMAYQQIASNAQPPLSEESYRVAIQASIDAVARTKGYDDGVSLATYKGSSVATYAADAEAFCAWRDPLWPFVFEKLAAVQAGTIPQPNVSELLAMLPAPPWPV